MTRAADLTRALVAPSPGAVDDGVREWLREDLSARIAPLAGRLDPGLPVVVTLSVVRQARIRPDSLAAPEEAFVWRPVFVRRSLGLAVVEACVTGRYRNPMEAVGPVAVEAVAAWERTGRRIFHWEPWLAGLPTGARASVLAEAVGWATSLWASVEWPALPAWPLLGGVDDRWRCPTAPGVQLKGRSELRIPLAPGRAGRPHPEPSAAPAALVSVSSGCPSATWSEELAFLALVAAVGSPSQPVPARVAGVWPDADRHTSLEIDRAALLAAADRVVDTVEAVVQAQPAMAGAN